MYIVFATNKFNEINKLFWPIATSMILSSILGFIDSAMMSQYDPLGVSAVNFATQVQQIFGPIYFGIISGVNIFTVQYFARKEYSKLKNLVGIAIVTLIPAMLGNFIVAFFFTDQFISFFIPADSHTGIMAASYMKLVAFNAFLMPIDMIFMFQYRAIKRPKIPLITSVSQAIINIMFNYCLIFGHFGFPELGIKGAAISTVSVRLIFFFVNIIIAKKVNAPFIGYPKQLFSFSKTMYKEVLDKMWPLIIVEFGFGFARVLYTKIYAYAPIEQYNAMQMAQLISFVINAFVIATANVSGIMAGGELSNGDEASLKNTMLNLRTYMAFCAVIIMVFSAFVLPNFIPLFNSGGEEGLITQLLIINGIYMAVRVFSSSAIAILKAGGDTKQIILIDAGMSYLIGIPVSVIALVIFGPNIVVLKIAVISEVIAKIISARIRMRKNIWKQKL